MSQEQKRNVVDGEYVEVETPKAPEPEVSCEVRVGMNSDGSIYFFTSGSDQNLVAISGLLEYFSKKKDQMWETALNRAGK